MKAKTVLMTAVITAGTAISALAQSVYSVNVVGYATVALSPGFTLVCNPLNNTAGNLLYNIITNVPDGTTVYMYTNGAFKLYQYFDGAGMVDLDAGVLATNVTLDPGKSAFFLVPGGVATNLTFVGEVLQGQTATTIGSGFNFLSVPVPLVGGVTTVHNLPAADSDTYYKWNPATQAFRLFQYFDGAGWVDLDAGALSEPAPQVGEGFIYTKFSGVTNWIRSYNITN
jgi:hypothetical protein